MQRVAIIGCGGAGKSFVARELGRRLEIEVIHLDRLYWSRQWEPCPADRWEMLHQRLVERDTWIIDGNYGATMQLRLAAADTVLFLDLPRRVCLTAVIRRRLRYRGRARPDAVGAERLSFAFMRWIWTYRRERRPRVLERLAALDANVTVVILRSRIEVHGFLNSIPAPEQARIGQPKPPLQPPRP